MKKGKGFKTAARIVSRERIRSILAGWETPGVQEEEQVFTHSQARRVQSVQMTRPDPTPLSCDLEELLDQQDYERAMEIFADEMEMVPLNRPLPRIRTARFRV